MTQFRILKSGFVFLPCPRCSSSNRFSLHELAGPLGIFCKDCGSSFDRELMTRIRAAIANDFIHPRSRVKGLALESSDDIPPLNRI